MKLTQQQLRRFETFGYLHFHGLFAKEIGGIIDRFQAIFDAQGGGHNGQSHDHKRNSNIMQFIDRDDTLSALLDDPRIDGVVRAVLDDDDYNYMSSDANLFAKDTDWHSDSSYDSKYRAIKIVFYLETLTRETGCLRVIPGSHLFGGRFADALRAMAPTSHDHRHEEVFGLAGHEIPSVALECEPGDMIVFDHHLKHASYGGGSKRPMFTMNYQQRHEEQDLPQLRKQIENQHIFWIDNAYGEAMIRTAGPERMRHLEQRLANIGRLPQLAHKARQEMEEPVRFG